MPLVTEPVPYFSEDEWQRCRDPERMLYFLCYHWRQNLPRWFQPAKRSSRKLRLLACAFERLDPELDDVKRHGIELAERFADGLASKAELRAARLAQGELRSFNDLAALYPYPYDAAYHSASRSASDMELTLVRDVFGNPYRPVKVQSSWLTRDVVSLARAIYSDRAFDRLPELAGALEEAGCTNTSVLAHCRGSTHHVRGCWVVDLVLKLK